MRLIAAALLAGALLAGSSESPQIAGQIRIAAAADLKFVLDEISSAFTNHHPRCAVKTSYGASGNLFAQIQNGAPFDVFLSADTNYPHRLIESGHASEVFLYAEGHLVLWVPNSSKLDIGKLGLEALLDPAVRKIAIANPAHAPYGRAAVAALKQAGIHDRVAGSFVLGENIVQAAQFAQSGGADAAILGLSLARSLALRTQGRYIELPATLDQGGVVITRSKNIAAARAFSRFLAGSEARAILSRYGLSRN